MGTLSHFSKSLCKGTASPGQPHEPMPLGKPTNMIKIDLVRPASKNPHIRRECHVGFSAQLLYRIPHLGMTIGNSEQQPPQSRMCYLSNSGCWRDIAAFLLW